MVVRVSRQVPPGSVQNPLAVLFRNGFKGLGKGVPHLNFYENKPAAPRGNQVDFPKRGLEPTFQNPVSLQKQ